MRYLLILAGEIARTLHLFLLYKNISLRNYVVDCVFIIIFKNLHKFYLSRLLIFVFNIDIYNLYLGYLLSILKD